MKITGWIVLVYGLLILGGGIFGHVKAASTASLVMGIIFGALLLGSAWAIFRGKVFGQYCALILSLILDGFFTYRFLHTHRFMPAGMLSLLSLIVLIILALRLRKAKANR